jgi:hypothetical protein
MLDNSEQVHLPTPKIKFWAGVVVIKSRAQWSAP